MRVAIFDFDGTLYEEETFKLLMNHLKEHPTYHPQYKRFYRSIVPPYIANKLKLYPTTNMKKRSMQLYLEAFEGRSRDEMYQYFDELKEQMQKNFNKKVLEKLNAHQQENVHIYLVSGAYTQFLERVTEGISFKQIIGTEIIYKENSVYTKSPLEHVNGAMKTQKLLEQLEGQEIDWENSYAYGDSYSDLPVLELVGNPIAVKPEEKLRNLAQERGWEIIR
ncbi:HAD-IB family hydrolase [Psychrobacillus sp. AK 1817]|uniref:HAD-IB family hydrolase n=1 Tax=Psychrobacillus faecigallinarum TaxID=2762235 RepID=A0ABR8RBT5_9BACI|nr:MULTISPECIES: HAD-IB family hydrolase [Psychrobacillus]MBD7945257.1 HAD-IB family hydrolase [Psychrobacillus faecigallinarum]QEY19799.1 HAD-IB family hydrolase [Psychrobacillus sp. AK 1817]